MIEFLEVGIDKFTFKVATGRFYTAEGVWAAANDRVIRIGLSDFLQQRSGDIAFADVKPEGTVLRAGDDVATIETIKVNLNLTSPINGKIVQVNPLMQTAPEMINQDPYGEGWLCEIEPENWEHSHKLLLDATAYFSRMKQEAESEVKKDE